MILSTCNLQDEYCFENIIALVILLFWLIQNMILVRILTILWLLVLTSSQNITELQCESIGSLTKQEQWSLIQISTFDIYLLISAGSISLVGLIIAACSFQLYKSFSPPSDILFVIIIAQIIQNSSLVASAGYFLTYRNQPVPPSSFSSACFTIGVINIIGYIVSTISNVMFCVIMAYSIRNTLKGIHVRQWWYHLASFLIILALIFTTIFTGNVGRGASGFCGFKISNAQSLVRLILQIFVCVICVLCMYQFRLKVPKNSYFKQQAIFGFYIYYMGLYSLVQFITTVLFFIGHIACLINSNSENSIVKISYSIGNVSYLVLSFVLIVMRFSHPILRRKINSYIKTIKVDNEIKNEISQAIEMQVVRPGTKSSQYIEVIKDQDQDNSWLGCLLQSIKGSEILSFLTGINLGYIQMRSSYENNQKYRDKDSLSQNLQNIKYKDINQQKFTKHYHSRFGRLRRHYCVNFDEQIIDQYILRRVSDQQSLLLQKKLDGLRTLSYEMVLYYPEMYIQLIKKQPQSQDILSSFDIKRNASHVKKQSYTNGGKSGQFFYGTYNNKYVFKTISQDQAEVCIEKSFKFYSYFMENPQSLIVNILGLYKFTRRDIQQKPIHLILMRNLSQNSKDKNIRVYDIKGSMFNRSTIEDKGIKNLDQPELRKYTLKDKDFLQLEGSVNIYKEAALALKYELRKDINFLSEIGVMDYSLLIIKRKFSERTSSFGLFQLPSSTCSDQVYNFGLIDYLGAWNLKRKAERALKMLVTNEEVTAQSPDNYAKRLINFLQEII